MMSLQVVTRNHSLAQGTCVGCFDTNKWDGQECVSFYFAQWDGLFVLSAHLKETDCGLKQLINSWGIPGALLLM